MKYILIIIGAFLLAACGPSGVLESKTTREYKITYYFSGKHAKASLEDVKTGRTYEKVGLGSKYCQTGPMIGRVFSLVESIYVREDHTKYTQVDASPVCRG